MKKIFVLLVCLLFSLNATASCPKQKVEIHFKYKIGKVIYNYSLSRYEFSKKAPQFRKNPSNLLGLTISKLDVGFPRVEGKIFQHKGLYCVGVSKINFEIGFDKFNVYIDKKYKQGTCERHVVKEHEDEHVTIYKEGMHFFAPDIKKAIRKAAQEVEPKAVKTQAAAQKIFEEQAREIVRKVDPLLKHINKKLEEKQGMIDTPESYAKTSRKCKNW
ncbi:MAG: hypothetical protein IJD25_01670 [Alphaproteobacteria bacterium]|nr:hypothetical protein [Alphaproteobacteria bacterium]